jgi:hypothetical protein
MATFYQPPPDPEQILRDMAKYVAALRCAEVTIIINVSPSECSTSVYDRRASALQRAIAAGGEIKAPCADGVSVAQPEQEPVLWARLTESGKVARFDGRLMVCEHRNEHHTDPLYARPPAVTLPPLPLWFDDADRSWWGPDPLTYDVLLAWLKSVLRAAGVEVK